jgi:hypothetical protein
MITTGSAPGTAHQAHRTVKTALNEAVRRGHTARNPAQLAKAPRVEEEEIEPFTVEEARRLLTAAADRRNGVRFAIALSLGLRKGEALGLKWHRLDLNNGLLRTPKQLQRHKWEHGCANPHACGARLHKTEHCPKDCQRHVRPCPQPCPPNCVRHASACPLRHGGGLVEVDVKNLVPASEQLEYRALYCGHCVSIRQHKIGSASMQRNSGRKVVGYSPNPTAARSIHGLIMTNGRHCSSPQGCEMPDCTTRVTRRRLCSLFSVCRLVP